MPTLTQGKDAIRGRRILYDMDSGEGTIFDGRIRFKEGFYSGNRIDTRGEEEFHVHSGSYTTCDLPGAPLRFLQSPDQGPGRRDGDRPARSTCA